MKLNMPKIDTGYPVVNRLWNRV